MSSSNSNHALTTNDDSLIILFCSVLFIAMFYCCGIVFGTVRYGVCFVFVFGLGPGPGRCDVSLGVIFGICQRWVEVGPFTVHG